MTVLLVGPVAPPQGGMALSLSELARHLPDIGVETRVLRTNPRLGIFAKIPLARSVLSFTVFVCAALWHASKARRVHLLGASHTYFWTRCAPLLLLAKLFGWRVVLHYKGGLLEDFLRRWPRLAPWVMRRAAAVAVPSAFLQRALTSHGLSASLLPNFADVNGFPFSPRDSLPRHCLVARTLDPLYGVDVVLGAFARARKEIGDLTLSVAGDGPERARLEARGQTLGGVNFHGNLGRAELAKLHAQSGVLLNASRADNVPHTLLEAMASGLPIVSTAAGGIPDMVRHGEEALLVPVDDEQALAEAIITVYRDEAGARRRAQAAHARVLEFAPAAVLAQFRRVHQL
jgi:glycosyltransferase involved in cell wall biosynthesis